MLKRHPGERGRRSRALLSAGGLFVAGCSLQDLDYLGVKDGQDSGLSGSINTSGAGGDTGRGGTGSATNGGDGGSEQGGQGGSSSTGGSSGEGAGGSSAGTGGSGSGGTTGGVGAGGSAGTAPINYGGGAGYLGTNTLPDGGPDGNLIQDPSFDSGIVGWTGVGTPTLTWTTTGPADGTHCLRASSRSQDWMGPSYSLLSVVIPGETYSLSAYARLSHAGPIKFTAKSICQGQSDPNYDDIILSEAATSWALYEGTFTVPSTCTLTDYRVFAEKGLVNVDIFLDAVRVVPAP